MIFVRNSTFAAVGCSLLCYFGVAKKKKNRSEQN